MAVKSPDFSIARYGLELNGAPMGFVESFEGGSATADVGVKAPGPDGIARKYLGPVKYEEIMLTCGATMSKPFYDWLATALNEQSSPQNGAVVAYDSNSAEVWRLNFVEALVSEVGFPALDASSNDTATLSVKLSAERTTRDTTNAGKGAATGFVTQNLTQRTTKRWLLSNFRLNIDGLYCGTVNRIEAIGVTQPVPQYSIGEARDYKLPPSYQQVSNLVIALPDDSKAADFYDWHQSFVIQENHSQDQEKNGTLELLSTNLRDVLFALQFNNLGIFRLATIRANAGAISRIQAEMYCDQVLLTTGGSAVGTITAQPGTTSATQLAIPANGGQPEVTATGVQIQAGPKTRRVSVPAPPNQLSAGSTTPSQGPRNLNPLQRQPVSPRSPTLRFRNLSSGADIT